jgi:hypothetical protein
MAIFRRKLIIVLGVLLVVFSLAMCDIAGTGEKIIHGGETAVDFVGKATRLLAPMVKQAAEDGLNMGQYIANLAKCMREGGSDDYCMSQVRQTAMQDCLKTHDYSHCSARYGGQ